MTSTHLPSPVADTPARDPLPRDVRTLIVGAGFGGVDAAIQLRAAGQRDLLIIERAPDAGGCWLANTYPGIACDVPSNLYSFSFAPNPDWTRTYSPGGEIARYIHDVATRYGVMDDIRFGVEATGARWLDDAQRWEVETNAGTIRAQFLVSAMGPLTEPVYPEIDGRDTFEGIQIHSARWDHSADLAGKRVAAIGTGASAIQFVPAVAKSAGHLEVFQRTAPWVLPRTDRGTTAIERRLFRRFPPLQRLSRKATYWSREVLVAGMRGNLVVRKALEGLGRFHLRRQVADPQLRRQLTPDFALGCKRILLSNAWYPALQRPNVDLVTSDITEITPTAVVTADGVTHEVDAIIYGTGFHVTTPPAADVVVGRDGKTLAEHWQGSPKAFLGTSIDGFPNLFFLVGPNSGVGHTSILLMIEWQVRYLTQAIARAAAEDIGSYDLRPDVMDQWVREIDELSAGTVWLAGGCASYYVDRTGRNSSTWPTYTFKLRERLATFDAGRYEARPVLAPVPAA
ncbi:MAG: NAD(P)/FAD-dependent oxidoreductase [Solirubrobacteraceae bacterium]|nr:NAD(P)/FAD-dependent oxidoreductase [Solirubrobacteraceae bacterium]